MKSRRVLSSLVVLSLCCSILSLAGCSKASGSSSESSSSAASGSESSSAGSGGSTSTQTVKFWYYFSNVTGQAMQKNIENYNKSQNKYAVKGQYIPFADLKKQITVGAAASSLPDIVQIDNPDHASFAAMGILADITDKVKSWGQADSFYKGPVNSCIYNGKYYGLPLDSNCLALFYNKDLCDAAGVTSGPKTWDELTADAAKLTKGSVKGFAMSAIKTEEGAFQFMPFLWQAGADYNSLDSAGGISSMSFLTNLVQKGYMSKDVINQAQGDVLSAQFEPGKAAIMLNGTWEISQLNTDKVSFKWGVWLLPTNKNNDSVLGGENIAIIKSTQAREDAAWDFIKYIESPTVAEQWYKDAGYMPSRKDVADKSTYWKNDPLLSVFAEQMNSAQARGPHPKWPQISSAIQTAEQESLTGAKTPDAAMKEAAATVKSVIQ